MYVPSSELGLPPTPLPQASVPSPSGPKGVGGGGQTRLRLKGWGSPNFDDWRKGLALCQLCGLATPVPGLQHCVFSGQYAKSLLPPGQHLVQYFLCLSHCKTCLRNMFCNEAVKETWIRKLDPNQETDFSLQMKQ